MAEAFAVAHGNEEMDFFSAGLVPAGFVRPQALSVLEEMGLEVSWEHPRYLLPEHLIGVDYLVTIGCDPEEDRLKHSQAKHIAWDVEHVLNKGLEVAFYRETRNRVEALVKELVEALREGTADAMAAPPEEKAEPS